jgi:hypothetical protein
MSSNNRRLNETTRKNARFCCALQCLRHSGDLEINPRYRSPGESRDPPISTSGVQKWIPAFAGNALFAG